MAKRYLERVTKVSFFNMNNQTSSENDYEQLLQCTQPKK